MRIHITIGLLALCSCRSTGSLTGDTASIDDTDSPVDDTDSNPGIGTVDEGFGNTIGTQDEGSGPAVGQYRVVATASGDQVDAGGLMTMETELDVRVWDSSGQQLDGARVSVHTANYGDTELDPTGNGRYEGVQFGYDRTYRLTVEGPEGVFSATAVGPAIHTIDPGSTPIDVALPWTIRWNPHGAQTASIDTEGGGLELIADSGTFTLEAETAEYELAETGEERVRIRREDTLNLTGAVNPSSFTVGVRRTARDLDTTDTRTGSLSGSVPLDGDLEEDRQDEGQGPYSGTVYVLCWPETINGEGPPWAWTSIEDWPTQQDYALGGLPPGEWACVAYLDMNGSDEGLATPGGPQADDPYREHDLQIEPDGTHDRNFRLDDLY